MLSILNINHHLSAVVDLIHLLSRFRVLTWEMAKREINDRFAGQFLGKFWTFIHPLAQMCIYIYVFNIVFKITFPHSAEFPRDYVMFLMSGLIPWLCTVDVIAKSNVSITGNSNLVKQVVFPIEILPVKSVIASFMTMLVFLVILLAYNLFSGQEIALSLLLLPLIIFFHALMLTGVSYILSSIAPYFRDSKDVVQIIILMGIYILPVVYHPASEPEMLKGFFYFNPFSYMIWCYKDAIYYGRLEHPIAWVIFPILSLIIFSFGYRVFRHLKVMFGDVL